MWAVKTTTKTGEELSLYLLSKLNPSMIDYSMIDYEEISFSTRHVRNSRKVVEERKSQPNFFT